MRDKDTRQIILDAVVYSYIQNPQPIGSTQLKEQAIADLSSATIRNYFRKLVEDGLLTQLHSSGGRIPTEAAFRNYWLSAIDCDEPSAIDREKIGEAASAYGLYAILQEKEQNRLIEVTKGKLGRILASFERGETALGASAAIEKLLIEFTGYDIADLIAIAKSNRIDALYRALCQVEKARAERFNEDALFAYAAQTPFDFSRFFDKSIAINLPSRMYFDAPMMTIAKRVAVDRKPALLLAFGAMNRDFLGFINHIKKEEE